MKAIVQDTYGPADVLELREVDRPEIGDGDVLVRVHAAGLHIGDWHVMTGQPYLMRVLGFGFRGPKARVRGMDVAGVVEAIGTGVTRFKPGDEVFGVADGAFAEYAHASEDKLALKPANLSFEQAAAVPTSACTALVALRDQGKVQAGQKVLIIGASGGIGLFAVQLAKYYGADVTGVASASKADLVRSLGAGRVIDYAREDFVRGGERFDVILDMVGNRSLKELRSVLTPRGTLVIVGGEGGGRMIGALSRSLQALFLKPFVKQQLRLFVATANAADLQFLKDRIEAGDVTPIVDRTYPLRETSAAMRALAGGHARGKLVIAV